MLSTRIVKVDDTQTEGSALDRALEDFKSSLTPDECEDLRKESVGSESVIAFTSRLDQLSGEAHDHHRHRKVASCFKKVLQFAWDLREIVDVFVSSNPEIAALVWGGVKLTIKIALNVFTFYESVAHLFIELGEYCPLFSSYEQLYKNSTRLKTALVEFHASIVRCCHGLLTIKIKKNWVNKAVSSLRGDLDQHFKEFRDEFQRRKAHVENAITHAKAWADEEHHQQLTQQIADDGSHTRQFLESRLDSLFAGRRSSQALRSTFRDGQESLEKKKRALDRFCSHQPQEKYEENQFRRYKNTSMWFLETEEFRKWIDKKGSRVFGLWGKIGTGKTMITTSVLEFMMASLPQLEGSIAYAFVDATDQSLLQAAVILKSILRQLLPEANRLSDDEASEIERLTNSSDTFEITRSLVARIKSTPKVIVVDGLDACDRRQRRDLLAALSSLHSVVPHVRLFLSGRESLPGELGPHFQDTLSVFTDRPGACDDMETYIQEIFQEMDLVGLIGSDHELLQYVQDELHKRADGMLLWVCFQVKDICQQLQQQQHNVRDTINSAIKNLPTGLQETYRRALTRIAPHKKSTARDCFHWIAAATRTLTVSELEEAISIRVDDTQSRPQRFCPDMRNITSWSESLVHVDEFKSTIYFSHHTIFTFLTSVDLSRDFDTFHIDLKRQSHHMGEMCLTYLGFSDFERALVDPKSHEHKATKRHIDPINYPRTALSLGQHRERALLAVQGISNKFTLKASKFRIRGRYPKPAAPSTESSADGLEADVRSLQIGYPFLRYACTEWISHTKEFYPENTTKWGFWRRILAEGHALAKIPWEYDGSPASDRSAIIKWARHNQNSALLVWISSSCSEKILTSLTEGIESESPPPQDQRAKLRQLLRENYEHVRPMKLPRNLPRHLHNPAGASPATNFVTLLSRLLGPFDGEEEMKRILTSAWWIALQSDKSAVQRFGIDGLLTKKSGVMLKEHLQVQDEARITLLHNVANVLTARSDEKTQSDKGDGVNAWTRDPVYTFLSVWGDPSWGITKDSALMMAFDRRCTVVIDALLLMGASFDEAPCGQSARAQLWRSIMRAQLEERELEAPELEYLQQLLQARAPIHSRKEGGHAALGHALSLLVHENQTRGFSRKDAVANKLHRNSRATRNVEIITALLKAGADPNQTYMMDSEETVLCKAILEEEEQIISALLEAGADPDRGYSDDYCTVLGKAVQLQNIEIVEMLLGAGADPNQIFSKRSRYTVLLSAIFRGDERVVSALLKAGADPNRGYTDYRRTHLGAAAFDGKATIVESLLKAGANPNQGDLHDPKVTALCSVLSSTLPDAEKEPVVQALLKGGADPNRSDVWKKERGMSGI